MGTILDPPTSVAHGVLHSLPDKIKELSTNDGLRKIERKQIENLNDVLHEYINGLQSPPAEIQPSAGGTGYWVKEVRDLSYDIDDFIDKLVQAIHSQRNPRRNVSTIAKLRDCLNRRRWIVTEVSRFRACLQEAIRWQQRGSVASSVDPRVAAGQQQVDEPAIPQPESPSTVPYVDPDLYEMVPAGLVGKESSCSISRIGRLLTDQGEDRHLRVISLVGSGGVGKTTLARQLYDRFGRQFHCRVFVQLSQKPDMKRLLTGILEQIQPYRPPDGTFESCNLIIDTIRQLLRHKKYLIVIDDIWALSTWDIISHALPDDNYSSRILMTTEVDIVAQRCCGYNTKLMFHMKPLSDEKSKELFISIVTGRKYESPVELDKVPYEAITKCGGFPLATILMANLFKRQRDINTVDWDNIWKLVCSSFETISSNIDGMKQVLILCYKNLPDHLKACMLYLSMYKEDHVIRKVDLVRQWIIEGFICEEQGKDMVEVAYNYFDELVSRGMIQAVDTKYNGEVLFCTVHYMILNVIRDLSTEENFVISIDHSQTITRHVDKVRRLSLHLGDAEDAERSKLFEASHVRSMVFFGLLKCLPCMVEFQLLRVLIIHLWSEQGNRSLDLTTICKLFRLRYLEMSCNTNLNLQLQLPPDIVHLPCLSHLIIPGDTELGNGIELMTSLATLECFDLSRNSLKTVESLSKLTNLWDLRLTCSMVPCDKLEEKISSFVKIVLREMENLKSLLLVPAPRSSNLSTLEASSSSNNNISFEALRTESPLPKLLERLEFSPRICIFNSFPVGINQNLSRLRILKIAVCELCQNDVNTLKQLSALTSLALYVRALQELIVFDKDGFQCLKHFKFICTVLRIEIIEGAMLNVRRLKLGFSAETVKECSPKDSGFQYMTGLEVVSAKIGTDRADEKRRNVAKSDLEAAFGQRKVNVQWVPSVFTTEAQNGERHIHTRPPVITNDRSAEQHGIGKGASAEDTKRIADSSRTDVSAKPDLDMQILGMKPSMPGYHKVLGQTKLVMKYATSQLFKLKGFHVKTELESIRQEMGLMSIIIDENSGNELGALPESWITQLQDLVYDIEDFTDIYNHMNVISSSVTSNPMSIRRRVCILEHLSQIMPLKNRLKSLQKWQQGPISSHGGGPTTSGTSAGLCPFVPLAPDELVGMVEPTTELESLVVSDTHPELLAVISITGCRGMGKTTLAALVYHSFLVCQHFDLRAWVVASDCNSAEEFLETIAQQVYGQRFMKGTHVRNKRCLVVIDGMQQAELWYNIRGALAEIGPGSRIIITTSIQSVATNCSPEKYIYRMRGHDSEMLKKLFWRMVECRVSHTPVLDDALEGTLEKCDGVPLALVDVAKYFRAKGKNLHQLELGLGAFEGVNRVLTECYNSLPDRCGRACLLSLSKFPHGHPIKRKSLIRTWIAEGLVKEDSTHSAEQVGDACFDQLVDRNLIEPVLIGNNSKVKTCRVRAFLLDFIINKAVSKGFVSLIHDNKLIHNNQGAHPVRRLSVHGSNEESTRRLAGALGHVRSLTLQNSELFDFQSCRLVRVLDLEGCQGIDDWALGCICQLILVRYLSLRGSDVHQIPKIIKKLQCLETLDVRDTQVKKLPVECIILPRLTHLFGRFKLPRELNKKKMSKKQVASLSDNSVLQTLSGFCIDEGGGFELVLEQMKSLRKVKIWCDDSITADTEHLLAYSLRKSFSGDNGIESLSIDFGYHSIDFLNSVLLEGPSRLSSVKLRGRLTKLPNFIALLDNISELQLSFTLLSIEDLSALQHFRRLVYLKLVKGPRAFWGGRFIVQKGGFPSLLRLCLEAPQLPDVHIHEGGMSAVTSIQLLCPEFALHTKFSGIQNLKYLNEVVLHADVGNEELAQWKDEARGHQNRPKVYKQGAT